MANQNFSLASQTQSLICSSESLSSPRVPPGGSAQTETRVTADDYLDVLGDQALLSVTVLALVEETEQSWVGKLPYRLRRPDLDVSIDGRAGSFLDEERFLMVFFSQLKLKQKKLEQKTYI